MKYYQYLQQEVYQYSKQICRYLFKTSIYIIRKRRKFLDIYGKYFCLVWRVIGSQYIYFTCHSKCIKDKIPCKASCNKMELKDIPPAPEFVLRRLESISSEACI